MKYLVHLLIIGSLLASTTKSFSMEIALVLDNDQHTVDSSHLSQDQKAQEPMTNLDDSEEEEEEEPEEESSFFDQSLFLHKNLIRSGLTYRSNYGALYLEPEKRPPRTKF